MGFRYPILTFDNHRVAIYAYLYDADFAQVGLYSQQRLMNDGLFSHGVEKLLEETCERLRWYLVNTNHVDTTG